MKIGKNTSWLVKSNGRVLGPYLDHQVNDLLRERIIVPLDEVSRPCDRWKYIRDEPLFAKIVEEIRIRNLRRMQDETTTRGGASDSELTQSVTSNLDELTQDITTTPINVVQDIAFNSIEDAPTQEKKTNGDAYTHDNDFIVKQKAQETSRWVWALTAFIILSAVAYVFFHQFVAKPIHNKAQLESSIAGGIESLEQGDYDKALDFFQKANQVDPRDMSIYLYLGVLKIQLTGNTLEGRQFLEKLITQKDQDLKKVYTAIGLSYIKDRDWNAAEQNFNKALEIDALFAPAVINLGAVAMYEEDWPKASNYLQLVIKDGSQDGAEYLMLTETLLRQYFATKEKKYLNEALTNLNDFRSKSMDFSLESAVGTTYVDYLLNDKAKVYQNIDEMLDMDPMQTEDHRHNLFIHRANVNWKLISQWCLKTTQDLDPNSHVIAFEALCLLKSGDVAEAFRKIDSAVSQTPKDPLVLSHYAYILNEMHSQERSAVYLEKAFILDREKKYALPRRLKALNCQRIGDIDCERKYWEHVLNMRPQALDALSNLAILLLNEKNVAEAKKYFLKGFQLSNNYKNFYQINRSISQAEDREKSRGL